MIKTKVIHISKAPANWKDNSNYVYIGRGGRLGNPFVLGADGNRAQVLSKYRAHLEEQLRENPEMMQLLRWIKGRILVCYCKPKRCHGDILAFYADQLQDEDG